MFKNQDLQSYLQQLNGREAIIEKVYDTFETQDGQPIYNVFIQPTSPDDGELSIDYMSQEDADADVDEVERNYPNVSIVGY